MTTSEDKKLRSNRVTWHGHVMRRDEQNGVKKVLSMDVDGYESRGRPKKKWMVKHNNNTTQPKLRLAWG